MASHYSLKSIMVASCYISLGPKTLCNQGPVYLSKLFRHRFLPQLCPSFSVAFFRLARYSLLLPTPGSLHTLHPTQNSLLHSCHPAHDQVQCPFCRRPLPDTTDAFIISIVFIKSIINAKLYDQLLYACFSCQNMKAMRSRSLSSLFTEQNSGWHIVRVQ